MSFTYLPLLPLLKAFGHLSDLDMINLSFCSRRTAQLVNTSKRFTGTSRIFYKSHDDIHKISVQTFKVYDMSMFTICLAPSWKRELLPSRFIGGTNVQETVSFRGFAMNSFKREGWDQEQFSAIFYNTMEDFLLLHEALTEHFLDLHVTPDVDPPELTLTVAPSDILTYPFLKNWKKWDMVTITEYCGCSENYVSDEMGFLLNDSEYTDDLELYIDVEKGFEYSEGFQLESIHFCHSSWIKMDSIINSTSQSLILQKFPRATASQLINILKLWIAKEKMVNLEFLRLESDLDFDWNLIGFEERLREIWQGIGFPTLGEATKGEILRVDGVRAEVDMRYPNFTLCVVNE